MTTSDRAQLDREVAEVLENSSGGERIGVNQIAWKGRGAVMTLALPGEAVARAPGRPISTMANCSAGRVCLWEHADSSGDQLTFYKCKFQKLRWYDFTNETSSWENDQTDGTYSSLHYWDGSDVRYLDSSDAWDFTQFIGPYDHKNDRADFLRVC